MIPFRQVFQIISRGSKAKICVTRGTLVTTRVLTTGLPVLSAHAAKREPFLQEIVA